MRSATPSAPSQTTPPSADGSQTRAVASASSDSAPTSWSRTSRASTTARCAWLAALTLPLLHATAQTLQFGEPTPPQPGALSAFLDLADQCDARADDADHAHAPLLRLARDLLRTGESLGRPGSPHVVAARTILNHLDSLAQRLVEPDDARLFSLLAARPIPHTTDDLDRFLRDTFAPLTRQAPPDSPSGWPPADPAPRPPDTPLADLIPQWESQGVPADAADALRALDDLCARADGWNAYAPSARRVRAAVRDAAAVLALDSLPLPAEARTALGYAFDNACRRSADDPTAALGQFETLALVARTCHDLTALPAAEQKQAFAALAGVIASDGAASERTARACTAAGRALRLLHAAPDPADERTLVRQTRPAWRALLRRLDRVHRQTAAAVPDLIAAPDSQQDPSTLSLLARHRGALDDLALVRAASDAFTRDLDGSPASEPTSQPAVADVWNTVARRVLELGQALGTQGEDDDAAQALRFTCSRIVRYTSVPGEHELRAVLASQRTGTPWERLTAGRHADLLAALEHARRLWVVDLGSNPAADSPLLETLAQICATAYDLAALLDAADRAQATGRPPGAIQSWPGFECDPRSWAARADEAPPILARAVEAALAGRDLQAAEVLDTLTTDHADTLLLARLERAAIARGLARPAPTDPAAQLAAGAPPPDAFLADLRTAIADVCRYTDASVAQPDSDAARQARTFATTISRRLLDSPENFR